MRWRRHVAHLSVRDRCHHLGAEHLRVTVQQFCNLVHSLVAKLGSGSHLHSHRSPELVAQFLIPASEFQQGTS